MQKKILIVDDDKEICEAIERVLAEEGYKVFKAYNGKEALQEVNEKIPDLIILDILMPKLNGYAVCRKIRQNDLIKNIPVLMVTGVSSKTGKMGGYDAGADDYITKPFNNKELLARIETLLNRI
jgi:two-component system response regulator VicR